MTERTRVFARDWALSLSPPMKNRNTSRVVANVKDKVRDEKTGKWMVWSDEGDPRRRRPRTEEEKNLEPMI